MAINKVEYGGQVLIDLTADTVSADTLKKDYTAHAANGEVIVGTMEGGTSGELQVDNTVLSYGIAGEDSENQVLAAIQPFNLKRTLTTHEAYYTYTDFSNMYSNSGCGSCLIVLGVDRILHLMPNSKKWCIATYNSFPTDTQPSSLEFFDESFLIQEIQKVQLDETHYLILFLKSTGSGVVRILTITDEGYTLSESTTITIASISYLRAGNIASSYKISNNKVLLYTASYIIYITISNDYSITVTSQKISSLDSIKTRTHLFYLGNNKFVEIGMSGSSLVGYFFEYNPELDSMSFLFKTSTTTGYADELNNSIPDIIQLDEKTFYVLFNYRKDSKYGGTLIGYELTFNDDYSIATKGTKLSLTNNFSTYVNYIISYKLPNGDILVCGSEGTNTPYWYLLRKRGGVWIKVISVYSTSGYIDDLYQNRTLPASDIWIDNDGNYYLYVIGNNQVGNSSYSNNGISGYKYYVGNYNIKSATLGSQMIIGITKNKLINGQTIEFLSPTTYMPFDLRR